MKPLFADIAIGASFYDPFSGEEFLKVNDTTAKQITGGDAVEGEMADFQPDEEVDAS